MTSGGGPVTRYFMDPYAVLTGNPPGAAAGPAQVPEFPLSPIAGLIAILLLPWVRGRARRGVSRPPAFSIP